MKPDEVGRITAKNSRTIVKIMQLIEERNKVPADSIEKELVLKSRIDRLQLRLNRRLKKCANWSDERVAIRMPTLEKRRKMESSYKNQNLDSQKWVTVVRAPTDEEGIGNPSHVQISTGSQNSYTEDHSAQLLMKGEVTTHHPLSRSAAAAAAAAEAKTAFASASGAAQKDSWPFLTEAEVRELEATDPEELKRRRRLDKDHKFFLKMRAERRGH
jgi:hypothetical protein